MTVRVFVPMDAAARSVGADEVADAIGTGNYIYDYTDVAVPTRSFPLAFTRTYNGLAPAACELGYGWTHTYDVSATDYSDEVAIVRHGDGRDGAGQRRRGVHGTADEHCSDEKSAHLRF